MPGNKKKKAKPPKTGAIPEKSASISTPNVKACLVTEKNKCGIEKTQIANRALFEAFSENQIDILVLLYDELRITKYIPAILNVAEEVDRNTSQLISALSIIIEAVSYTHLTLPTICSV